MPGLKLLDIYTRSVSAQASSGVDRVIAAASCHLCEQRPQNRGVTWIARRGATLSLLVLRINQPIVWKPANSVLTLFQPTELDRQADCANRRGLDGLRSQPRSRLQSGVPC